MAIKTATPYLILSGKADEAVAFYASALGAKVESLQRFGEVQNDCPDAMKNWVMHAALQLDNTMIFLSDGSPAEKPAPGGTVNVALSFDNAGQARECFDALSEGGKVFEALFDAPWGGLFGALRDRYGINWMFTSTT